ncbi:MAG: hypothetical protein DIKNOCCD_01138 [bacterium]|nr:hypothetical protein [bacterium]
MEWRFEPISHPDLRIADRRHWNEGWKKWWTGRKKAPGNSQAPNLFYNLSLSLDAS